VENSFPLEDLCAKEETATEEEQNRLRKSSQLKNTV